MKFRTLSVAFLAAGCSLTLVESAAAQVIFRTGPRTTFTPITPIVYPGGFSTPNYPGLGPTMPGYGGGSMPAFAGGYPGLGYGGPGYMGSPLWGGFPGLVPPNFILPGFAAAEPARQRPTLYPAIAYTEAVDQILLDLEEGKARIDIRLPTEDARVWFDGSPTTQTGLQRIFVTPALTQGKMYSFSIRAEWVDRQGQARTQTQTLTLQAGDAPIMAFGRR